VARTLRPGGRLMTLEEVAEYLAVTSRWIYDNHEQLGMPALRIGRGLRFRSDNLEAWLDTRTLS
jgi:excisionase family DNA binding protein